MACQSGEYYHVMNRGVDGRKIFTSPSDYERFKRGMFLFNTPRYVELRKVSDVLFLERFKSGELERYVDIISYCLVDNHFHIFLRQRMDNGVEDFLRKLIGGYTGYFNIRRKRKGVLFQSHTKIVHIKDNLHFDHLSKYIVLNTLDRVDKKWRSRGMVNLKRVKQLLLDYPHSSLRGILGLVEDPILSNDAVDEVINRGDFMNELLSWSSESLENLELPQ